MTTYKLSVSEAQGFMLEATGQEWPLSRLIEAGARAAVWLEPPPGLTGQQVDEAFGAGHRGGFEAPIIFGPDLQRVAFTRGDGTLEITTRPDGKMLRVDPPARFTADALRFSEASLRELVEAAAATETTAAAPDETPQERRARLLAWFEEESERDEHGALQRVFEREKQRRPTADRSNIGKDIKQARKERSASRLASPWMAQFGMK